MNIQKRLKPNIKKILIIILLLLLITGCTKQLQSKDKKPVQNKETGQNLIENIMCQPTNKDTIELYKQNGIDIKKLPKCEDFKINSGNYEDLWTSIFIKPLAFLLIIFGKNIGNYGISLIIVTLLIRIIAYPFTRRTAMQSELMKKAQPEITRIQKKYENKQDQESMMKQSQEMMMVYKKYNIKPMSGCIFSFIQLPLFIAFFEAVQRTPALFEDKLLKLQLGTTPIFGIKTSFAIAYIILILLIAGTTYFSFMMTMKDQPNQDSSMKMMPYMMTGMIIVTGLYMPSALGIYWVISNLFTIIQNLLVKRSKIQYGKN